MVEGNHVVYRISAPSPEEKEEWMKSIRCGAAGRRCWGPGCGPGSGCQYSVVIGKSLVSLRIAGRPSVTVRKL